MSKLYGVEWDTRELRLVSALRKGDTLQVEQAWSVPLDADAPEVVEAALKAELDSGRLSRGEALVCLSRRHVEIREFTLPPTPPEEQPDLVRFQAPREFTQFEESAVVDFYEIGLLEDSMHQVLAALLSGHRRDHLVECCRSVHLTPIRLALRPLCSAALLQGAEPAPRLLVDVGSEEADLAVHNGQLVLSVRNVRLPDDGAARAAALVGEVRRMLMVARGQLQKEVAEVVLFGSEPEHQELMAAWDLPTRLRLLNPVENTLPPSASPATPGRFASLMGLLRLEATGQRPELDFLHPRQRPKRKSRLSTVIPIAAVAALLLLIVAGAVLLQLASRDREIAKLSDQLKQAKKTAKAAEGTVEHLAELQVYFQSEINWLDELRRVSDVMPDGNDVLLTKLTARALEPQGGGQILIAGNASTTGTIDEMERRLRSPRHGVSGRGADFNEKEDKPWQFNETILVAAPPPLGSEPEEPASGAQADDAAHDAPAADSPRGDLRPTPEEPADAEPADAEPDDAAPADAEPAAEPDAAEPVDAEPADAAPDDAAPADAAPAEEGSTDPEAAEPPEEPPTQESAEVARRRGSQEDATP